MTILARRQSNGHTGTCSYTHAFASEANLNIQLEWELSTLGNFHAFGSALTPAFLLALTASDDTPQPRWLFLVASQHLAEKKSTLHMIEAFSFVRRVATSSALL